MTMKCKFCGHVSERVSLGLACFECGHRPDEMKTAGVITWIILVALLTALLVCIYSTPAEASERGSWLELEFSSGTQCVDGYDHEVYRVWITSEQISICDEEKNCHIYRVKATSPLDAPSHLAYIVKGGRVFGRPVKDGIRLSFEMKHMVDTKYLTCTP